MSSDGPGSDSGLRAALLVLEPEVEPDEAQQPARQLRAELEELDFEYVAPVTSEDVPEGVKGKPFSLGAPLITLSSTGGVFTTLIDSCIRRHEVG